MREHRQYSWFNRLMLWLHYLLMVSLLLAVSAKYISPALFWLPSFFGLAFPFLFLLNLVFGIYWLAQFKSPMLLALLMALVSLPTALRFVKFSFSTEEPKGKQLKVTSFNSMLFDLYNWSKNQQSRSHILAGITEINPDILCIQEFYTSEESGDYNNIDTLTRILHTRYYHSAYTTTLRDFDHWGIATFSKYPIINQGKIVFNTALNNICIYSDIKLPNDTIRIYNIHLQSVSFNKQDHQFLDQMLSDEEVKDKVDAGKGILRRLKAAFIKRSRQVDMITAHLSTCPYKVIICGDFNETAASYAYEELSRGLRDAFLEKGNGLGRTYAGKWPQFRIDYIMHDQQLNCTRYRRATETFTDHYPITAHFDNLLSN